MGYSMGRFFLGFLDMAFLAPFHDWERRKKGEQKHVGVGVGKKEWCRTQLRFFFRDFQKFADFSRGTF